MTRFAAILLTMCMLCVNCLAQEPNNLSLDSLVRIFNSLPDKDTNKVVVAYKIALTHRNIDSTFLWAEKTVKLAEKHKMPYYQASGMSFMGWACYYLEDLEGCIDYSYEALHLADSMENHRIMGFCYTNIANAYADHQVIEMACDRYVKALKQYRLLDDSARISQTLCKLAQNYYVSQIYDASEKFYREALDMDIKRGDSLNIVDDHLGLARLYLKQYEDRISEHNMEMIAKAKNELDIPKEFFSPISRFNYCKTMSNVLSYELDNLNLSPKQKNQKMDSIKSLLDEGFTLNNVMNLGSDVVDLYLIKAHYFALLGKRSQTKHLLDSISEILNEDEILMSSKAAVYYLSMSAYFQQERNIDSAMYYQAKYYEINIKGTSAIDYAFTSSHKLKEQELEQHKRKLELYSMKRRMRMKYLFFGIALICLFFVYVFYKKYLHTKELTNKNIKLQTQTEELRVMTEQLEHRNKEITDINLEVTKSISYASLIQRAAMPVEEVMKKLLGEYFLIYRPLHIVAGDFYWARKVGKFNIIVCADCTGHGVPGAFVSMLGISLLNEVTHNIGVNGNAGKILDELRDKVMLALCQDKQRYEAGEHVNMDGMDLAMVIIDPETKILHYSGAFRPLWLFRNNQLIQYKPDKMPVGLYLGAYCNFTDTEIQLMSGDVLYLFSDGIPDQFGYVDSKHDKYKHYSVKALATLVESIGNKPLDEQKTIIENTIDEFRNGYQQLDDNIMMGIKIS